jgi:SAM-dependent methyltransferase
MQTLDPDWFTLAPGASVLDLGCGEGRHVISAYLTGDVTAVGVDLSLDDLRTARSRCEEMPVPERGSFGLLAGDALRLPFADSCFDAVICSEVLEHIPDYRAALIEIRRVLKPDGRLCISVPRRWPERLCWWRREYHLVPGGHLRIFRDRALEEEIHALGFHRYHRHGAHALHVPYWWLRCLFWREGEQHWLVRQYHRLLVWDLLKAPRLTRWLERLLNPVMGKSVVLYFHRRVAS